MNVFASIDPAQAVRLMRPEGGTNLSRRRFLSFGAGAVVLGVLLPSLPERAFAAVPNAGPVKPGTRAPAFLVIGRTIR